VNTGFGSTTDVNATNSGFGNVGNDISGFNNTASGGGVHDSMSGFFNKVSGGSSVNEVVSGFFNTGVTAALNDAPSGVVSGFDTGFFNSGTGVAGFFGITNLLKNLGWLP
jgi:hypothetical protein